MDILTFLSNIIDSLAWPGLILAGLWLYRNPLSRLIDAISNAKFKLEKGETSIEGELNTVRELAPSIEEPEPPDNVRSLAESSPFKAIDESWNDLKAHASAAVSIPISDPPIKIADMLINKNILNQKEAEAFYKMYEIHNKVIKPSSKLITDVSSASAYSSIAHGLSKKIIAHGLLITEPASISGNVEVEQKSKKNQNGDES